jgi:hypothetical protein
VRAIKAEAKTLYSRIAQRVLAVMARVSVEQPLARVQVVLAGPKPPTTSSSHQQRQVPRARAPP